MCLSIRIQALGSSPPRPNIRLGVDNAINVYHRGYAMCASYHINWKEEGPYPCRLLALTEDHLPPGDMRMLSVNPLKVGPGNFPSHLLGQRGNARAGARVHRQVDSALQNDRRYAVVDRPHPNSIHRLGRHTSDLLISG